MNKFIFIFCLIIFSFSGLASNGQVDTISYDRQIGVHAGSTTGVGYSYRQWMGNFGVQATAIYGKKEGRFGSAGLSVMYSIHQTSYTRFYWYLGNAIYYSKEAYSNYSEYFYDIGSGPGFAFGRDMQFNLMFGYGIYNSNEGLSIFPTGEIGLYYCF